MIAENEKLADYWIVGGELSKNKKFYTRFFVRPELEKVPGENSCLDSVIEISRKEMFALLNQDKRVCVGFYNKKNKNYEYNGIVEQYWNRKANKYYLYLRPIQQRYDLLGSLPAIVPDGWDTRED